MFFSTAFPAFVLVSQAAVQVTAMPQQQSIFYEPDDSRPGFPSIEARDPMTAQEGLEAMSNTEQCPDNIPPQNRYNRTMQWPDGKYVCYMDGSMKPPCIERCGAKSSDKELGQINNCMGAYYASGPCKGRPLLNMMSGPKSKPGPQLGYCQCENGLVAEISKPVLDLLPAVGSFGCALLFGAFDLVLQAGISAIPGAGQANAAMVGGMRAAKIVSTSLKGAQKAATFTEWFSKPCGNNKYTEMADRIMNPLAMAADRNGIDGGPNKDNKPSLFASTAAPPPPPKSAAPTNQPDPKQQIMSQLPKMPKPPGIEHFLNKPAAPAQQKPAAPAPPQLK